MPPTTNGPLIKRVCLFLGWDYLGAFEDKKWTAKAPINWRSWGEKVTIEVIGPNQLRIRSNCSYPTQCFDWRKNAWNVKRFRQIMEALTMNG